MEPIIFL
jgi:hypothetical protein